MIEILRTAVVTPQLTPENFARVRDGRIKVIRELRFRRVCWRTGRSLHDYLAISLRPAVQRYSRIAGTGGTRRSNAGPRPLSES